MFDWALVSCAAAGRIEGTRSARGAWRWADLERAHQVQAANELMEGKVLDERLPTRWRRHLERHSRIPERLQATIARALIRRALMQLKA